MAEKRIHGDGGLHPDLWRDIFSLLPVRNLIILRSVCKSFLSIIADPAFVHFHLRHFPDNLYHARVLTVNRNSGNGIIAYEAIDITNNSQCSVISYESTRHMPLIASLDGLLLQVSLPDDKGYQIAELLNPSTRKRRPLPLPAPGIAQFGLRHHRGSIRKRRPLHLPAQGIAQFGLGHHRGDYKVVAWDPSRVQAWLYSINKGSWTEISKHGLHRDRWSAHLNFFERSLSFKDGVIWIDFWMTGNPRAVWFDFVSMRFRYTNKTTFYKTFQVRRLVELDGGFSVGVLGVDAKKQASVWALEADRRAWVRRYEFNLENIPWSTSAHLTIWCGERDGRFVWKYFEEWPPNRVVEAFSYDIKTKTIKYDEMAIEVDGVCLGLYRESLVTI